MKAEAAWDFGLLSSLPGELGRRGYQAVTFPYSRVGKVQPSSPWVCHWLVLAAFCAQQCHQTEEQWGLLLQLLRTVWFCQSSEKGRQEGMQ